MPWPLIILPTDIRTIEFVGVDPNVVAFVQPLILGGLGIDLYLTIGHAWGPFVGAMRIAKVIAPDPMPINGGPRRMRRVPTLRRASQVE